MNCAVFKARQPGVAIATTRKGCTMNEARPLFSVRRPREQGFSLTELMVTVAIIAILAAVALPSYTSSMRKAKRSDATAGLLELATAMQRYFYADNCYPDPAVTTLVTLSPSKYYTLAYTTGSATTSCPAGKGTTYTLTATPNTAAGFTAQQHDTSCPTITLTSAGVKSPSGCW